MSPAPSQPGGGGRPPLSASLGGTYFYGKSSFQCFWHQNFFFAQCCGQWGVHPLMPPHTALGFINRVQVQASSGEPPSGPSPLYMPLWPSRKLHPFPAKIAPNREVNNLSRPLCCCPLHCLRPCIFPPKEKWRIHVHRFLGGPMHTPPAWDLVLIHPLTHHPFWGSCTACPLGPPVSTGSLGGLQRGEGEKKYQIK